jgi:hypothetical protein
MFILIDCPANSDAAGTYTDHEHKMAASPPVKGNVCVVLRYKISYSNAKVIL